MLRADVANLADKLPDSVEIALCRRVDRRGAENSGIIGGSPEGRIGLLSGSSDNRCRVWDLATGDCLRLCLFTSSINSVSVENGISRLVCGTKAGVVSILAARNLPKSAPLITPVRLRLSGRPGRWDDGLTAVCNWCGQRFPVSTDILDTIRSITAHLSHDQSPCLELAAEAWDEPRLISECPLCHKALKFNPFIVDNRERY